MVIDFSVVSKIVQGLVLLVAGGLTNRFFERRARLVVFYGHVGEFHLQLQPQGIVRTHAVVIRNTGRLAAHNVHVPHQGMLNANNIHFSIDPAIANKLQTLVNNTEEIFFATLPAKFQVTISYLYSPPILYGQINAPIYSDEGQARVLTVLPQIQYPRWLLVLIWALILIGFGTVCYALVELMRWVK